MKKFKGYFPGMKEPEAMQQIMTLTFNPTVDAACEVYHVDAVQKIRTHDESFHPGGGGINVARVIDRLGGRALALYARGGVMGAVLDHLLEERRIDKEIIQIAGETRINNVIHEQATGSEYRFIAEGPVLQDSEWRDCINACEDKSWDWLVVSGSLPRGVPVAVYDELIALAKARGDEIIIDTSGEALQHVMQIGGATLIKPSQDEFEECTGQKYHRPEDIAAAAQQLVHSGISKAIAVTLGAEGAVMATHNETICLPSPKVKAISASGAGDSFVGGALYVLAKGGTVEDAFHLGIACGAATVMEKGTGLGTLENIQDICRHMAADSYARIFAS